LGLTAPAGDVAATPATVAKAIAIARRFRTAIIQAPRDPAVLRPPNHAR